MDERLALMQEVASLTIALGNARLMIVHLEKQIKELKEVKPEKKEDK